MNLPNVSIALNYCCFFCDRILFTQWHANIALGYWFDCLLYMHILCCDYQI